MLAFLLDAAQRTSYLAFDHLEPESEDGGQIPAQVGALAVPSPDILALQEITQGTHAYDERPKTDGLRRTA